MKKNIYTIALVSAFTAVLPLTALSTSAADVTVNATLSNTDFQAEQDKNFTTTVFVPENSNIASFEAVLNYDSSAVSLVDAKACKDSNGTVEVNKKDGKIYISYSSENNQTDKINVVDLTFHVNDDLSAGNYSFISLDSKETNNASSETDSGSSTDYKIKSGFTDMTIYQYGDADLNGKIQSRDVTYLKQYIVKIRELPDLSKKYSNAYMDFEEDGVTPKVNSRDAGIIQQKVVKMDVTLGDRVNVTFYDADGEVYAQKSVKKDSALNNVPDFPVQTGFEEYNWSLSPDKYVEVDFSKISSDTEIYAWYGSPDPYALKAKEVVNVLETGFAEEGKYITDDFQLPYKSNFGSFNMLSSKEYEGLDIIWSIKSGVLAQSVNISKDYVVDIPEQLPYTTWVDFTANIYFNGVKYGTHTFKREIKGIIDMPSPEQFMETINKIPKELPEHYRLPGYVSLESERLNYGVNTVQNVDIQWSVVKNSDGSTADKRVLDETNNEIIYLKDETNVTLQYDFIFDGNVIHTGRITRTVPEKPIEEQVEYAEQYIKSFVPSVISGETYFPTTVPLYDLTVSWIPDIESGKVDIGANETVNGTTYKVINVGEKAGYMEWAKVYANIERNGDDRFKRTGLEFDVQLAGNSTEISTDKIPDVNLYNALLNIFDKKYGDDNGILTEEEIYDTDVMEKLGYELDLSNKGITCLSGLKYLKYYKKIDLSGNDLSGENASLGELASLNYLEQLSLSNCGISDIPPSVFSSKFLIEGIDLSYNKLKNVDFLTLTDSRTQAEQPFTELKELFLQGNYITDISNLSFVDDSGETVSRIPNITVLTLSRDLNYYEYTTGENTGKKILKDLEDYEYDINTPMNIEPIGLMKNLTTLWLADNNISDISPLENCKLLATLDLSGNNISATVSSDGLEPLSKLQSLVCLKLDNNDIHTVKSLRRLIYLEILSLSNNHVGSVAGTLDNLSLLTYLDLDKNELSTFDAGPFPRLENLFLENQGYYTNDGEFVKTFEQILNLDRCPNITELRLNNNIIDSDSVQSIENLEKLEYLSLSGNNVSDLGFLQNLDGLKHLELANCNIAQSQETDGKDENTGEKISESVDNLSYLGGMKDLVILDLSDNPEIKDISALSPLTALEVFYINNVELESASAVRSMTKLNYLSMQNSGLTDFTFLNTLSQLKYLNLAGHKFDSFDFRNIRSCENIEGLFLDSAANTETVNIDTFTNKQNLRYFALSNMKIGSVDKLPDMDNITYLSLRNTDISDFNGSYSETDGYIYPITRFSTLKYLDVADNPELFTRKNLEMLYNFAGKPEQKVSVLLYNGDAPEGYVLGLMNPDIEIKRIAMDSDFFKSSVDVTEALNAGFKMQNVLNGYDSLWYSASNTGYSIKDNTLFFDDIHLLTDVLPVKLTLNGLYGFDETSTDVKIPWKISTKNVSFDANGGTCSTKSTTVTVGGTYGNLPVPSRDYFTFDGWFTKPTGGDKITSSTECTTIENITLYAHWTQNKVSDWVLKSEVPKDAQIVDTKYTYTNTSVTTSEESSMDGWELIDSVTNWTDWSGWSRDAVSGSDTRKVESRNVSDGYYGYTWYRIGHRYYYNYNVGTDYYGSTVTCQEWGLHSDDEWNSYTPIPAGTNSSGTYAGYNAGNTTGYNDGGGVIQFKGEHVTHDEYRYKDAYTIYTYQKTETLESSTIPEESETVSDIREYVKYRAK